MANAESKIKYLNVENGFVYFSLVETKQHVVPSCVAVTDKELWSFSLSEVDASQKLTLLITAFASDQNISVESSGMCVNGKTIEKSAALVVE